MHTIISVGKLPGWRWRFLGRQSGGGRLAAGFLGQQWEAAGWRRGFLGQRGGSD
jgi:hypothetical protein